MKKSLAFLMCLSAAGMLTACGGKTDTAQTTAGSTQAPAAGETTAEAKAETKGDPVVINYYDWDIPDQKFIDDFNAANPDIQVVAHSIPANGERLTKLDILAMSGSDMDVMPISDGDQFTRFESGMLASRDDFIAKDGIDMEKSFGKYAIWGQYDGKYYGIPFRATQSVVYYNKDMFDEAGIDYPDGSWTWDEFYDIAEKLTKEDGSQYGFAANPSNEQDTWMNIIYSMGGCVLTDDNKSGFDDPNTIKAMEFVDKCVKNVMPPASTMSETGTDVLFGSGKVAMISQGSWMVSAFKDNDYIKEHCDVARLPKDAETGESVSLYNGLGWAASANTDMPDEAFQLIEWFGTKDMQQKQADLGVTMAAYEGMSDGWVNSVDCFNLQPYMDAMDDIVFRPHTNATLAWWNPMCEELKKPWNDEESMDDACKNIVTIMNDAIAEESY